MHENSHTVDQATALRKLALSGSHSRSFRQIRSWSVTSGKGGVGKSVFALNFALHLSYSGRKVLLVDADENLGKLDVMMGVSPMYRIPDVLSGSIGIDDACVNPSSNLFLLAGCSGSMNYPEITVRERSRFIELISSTSKEFSDIVFDTGAGIHASVISYAAATDDVIVVSHPEPTAILDAYAAIKMISSRNSHCAFHVVMNKCVSPTECDDAAAKLQKAARHFLATDVRYAGMIPTDEAVGMSIVRQVPLVKHFSNSAASLCIQAITNSLAKQETTIIHQQKVAYV
jgi:flagellar biosynthesis protein FlhG